MRGRWKGDYFIGQKLSIIYPLDKNKINVDF